MSDSEVKRILDEIVKRKGGKVWIARRIGKRISYIDGLKAGRERYEPYEILHDDGEFVIFVEGVEKDGWLEKKIDEMMNLLKKRG